jgi:hypothetical protein
MGIKTTGKKWNPKTDSHLCEDGEKKCQKENK